MPLPLLLVLPLRNDGTVKSDVERIHSRLIGCCLQTGHRGQLESELTTRTADAPEQGQRRLHNAGHILAPSMMQQKRS